MSKMSDEVIGKLLMENCSKFDKMKSLGYGRMCCICKGYS